METIVQQISESAMAISFTTGFIFIIAATITLIFPPKSINYLYGYRTSSSMKNQERWDFAQRYSGIKMLQSGLFLIAFSLLNFFMKLNEDLQLIFSLIAIVLVIAILFFTTEKAIKKNFQNQ
jgi:uncharacterized membrane protein